MSGKARTKVKRLVDSGNQEPHPSTSDTTVKDEHKKIKLVVHPGSQSVPVESGVGRNPFQHCEILKVLGSWAPQADLANLKALSTEHYRTLKPMHLKSVEKCILIQEDYHEQSPNNPTINCSTMVDHSLKIITAKNWNPDLAPAFKELELSSMFFLKNQVKNTRSQANSGYIFASSLLEQLFPYITAVDVYNITECPGLTHPGMRYAEFWNQFENIHQLSLSYNNHSAPLPTAQLDIMVQGLRPNIQVSLKIQKLADIDNISTLARTMELYHHRIKISLGCIVVTNQQTLEDIVSFCQRIHFEDVNVKIWVTRRNFQDNERFRRTMTQLSPFLTKLIYGCIRANETVLDSDNEFSRLHTLHIGIYTKPLYILKKCPQLEKLQLCLSQTPCIFHDTNRTDREAIQEYFGNLPKLKELQFQREGANEENYKIYAGTPLEAFLKELLPQGIKIKYG